MPMMVNIVKGKPHKDGEEPVCTRCGKGLKNELYDTMKNETTGETWLYCGDCTAAMFASREWINEH